MERYGVAISVDAERAIQRMIERWDLHTDLRYCLPVPIRQVARDEGWDIRYVEGLFPLYGLAMIRGNRRRMAINAEVSPRWQRLAIAHEMGHVINGDLSGIHFCNDCDWLHNRQERAASMVAARLLIPDVSLHEVSTVAELAALCEVPLELVTLRLETQSVSYPIMHIRTWKLAS